MPSGQYTGQYTEMSGPTKAFESWFLGAGTIGTVKSWFWGAGTIGTVESWFLVKETIGTLYF